MLGATIDLKKCKNVGVYPEVNPMNIYDMVEIKDRKAQPSRDSDNIIRMVCSNWLPVSVIIIEDE